MSVQTKTERNARSSPLPVKNYVIRINLKQKFYKRTRFENDNFEDRDKIIL